jgi:hypothetical protein
MSLSHGITTTPASPGRTVPAITRRSNPEPEGNQTTDVVYLTCSGADVWLGPVLPRRPSQIGPILDLHLPRPYLSPPDPSCWVRFHHLWSPV